MCTICTRVYVPYVCSVGTCECVLRVRVFYVCTCVRGREDFLRTVLCPCPVPTRGSLLPPFLPETSLCGETRIGRPNRFRGTSSACPLWLDPNQGELFFLLSAFYLTGASDTERDLRLTVTK